MRLLLAMPFVSKKVKERIYKEVYKAFGGNFYEIIVGGAPLSKEVEEFLLSINFPLTVGYGTTECAPLISYCDWKDFKGGSCGIPVDRMEVKILSQDPENIPGEIVTKGTLQEYRCHTSSYRRGWLVSYRRFSNDVCQRTHLHTWPYQEHAAWRQWSECIS